MPSLSEIIINHNNITINDCWIITEEFSREQEHCVMILCNEMLRGYRCHDHKLSDDDAIISTLYMHRDNIDVVYEKNTTINVTSVCDTCTSLSIPYVLWCKSMLSFKNMKISVVLMIINSVSHKLVEIEFSNCILSNGLVILLRGIEYCKNLKKCTIINCSPLHSVTFFISSIAAMFSMREILAYSNSFYTQEVEKLSSDFIKYQNVSCIIMNDVFISGCRCSNKLFYDAIHLNFKVNYVSLLYCNINQFTFKIINKISCIKWVKITYSVFNMDSEIDNKLIIMSTHNKLEELYLGNNQLELKAAKIVVPSLNSISSLKSLDLSNNNLPS